MNTTTRGVKVSLIFCDIDVPFEKFPGSQEDANIRQVFKILKPKSASIRMSSGGNTHLKVVLAYPVTVLAYLQARAALGDDPQHLACDLTRMFRFGSDTARQNLTADRKIKQGRLMEAGDWGDYFVLC